MSFLELIWDAAHDVIDSYFIQSELVEVNLTDAERCETAFYDSLATSAVGEKKHRRSVPIGKQVW